MDWQIVKKRLTEQEEYAKRKQAMHLVERDSLKTINKHLNSPLIKAIIGPRRAGKTTLGLLLLRNKSFYYANFDDELLSKIKCEELGLFLESLTELFGNRQYIFLDEIQNISGWELFVNRLQRLDYNVIISGSNSHLLSKELSSHLGGRAISIEILPFSFNEFLQVNQTEIKETEQGIGLLKNKLAAYIQAGGFPEIILKSFDVETKNKYFEELFNTILFRDISQRFNIRNPAELTSIANILFNTFSTRASLTNIAKEIGISMPTVKKYVSYLDESYLLLQSKKFAHKIREIETSFKKYYCIDTGLLNAKKISTTIDTGRIMENIVAIELRRRNQQLYYYMIDNKYEVDFLILNNNKISEILQVVNDEKEIPKRELSSGIQACKKLHCNKLKIITWNKEAIQRKGKLEIKYIPLWKWLIDRK